MKNYKIVVTGATGFIGTRVIKLLSRKYSVNNILCLIWNKNNSLEIKGRTLIKSLNIKTKYIDLFTKYGLNANQLNPETIIHLAANTETSDSNHSVNDLGTFNLIDSLNKINKNTHIIYTSTTAIMSGRKDCSKPFNENSKPFPTNEYGRTKLKAENILIKRCLEGKFRLTIVRLPTVYGSGMRKNSFFDFNKTLVKRNSLLARLNWPGLTSFIHVDDVARALVALIKYPPEPSSYQTFILQSDYYNLQQIFKLIYKKLDKYYKPLKLPTKIWNITKFARKYIYLIEPLVPLNIYNYLWRASLIVDNVIFTKSDKIKTIIPSWKPKKLRKSLLLELIVI
jgi:nucleoside-diphosphate-sugar epimerase